MGSNVMHDLDPKVADCVQKHFRELITEDEYLTECDAFGNIPKLKLYAFQPNGHGEYSAFVMAYSEAEARSAVLASKERDGADNLYTDWMDGFNTNYYTVTVVEQGMPVFNAND